MTIKKTKRPVGRPKGTTKGITPSKVIRVPKDESLISKIRRLIKQWKSNETKTKKTIKKTRRPF